jgi:hypothetical protein
MQREKKGNEIIQILENQNAYLSIQINGTAYLNNFGRIRE